MWHLTLKRLRYLQRALPSAHQDELAAAPQLIPGSALYSSFGHVQKPRQAWVGEPAQASAWIRSDSVVNKYSLTDQGYGLRDNNVSLVLNWNTVPMTGLLRLHHGWSDIKEFKVPEEYS